MSGIEQRLGLDSGVRIWLELYLWRRDRIITMGVE